MFRGLLPPSAMGRPPQLRRWYIKGKDGNYLLYKEGSLKGAPKSFSSQEKAEDTLSKLTDLFPNGEVVEL